MDTGGICSRRQSSHSASRRTYDDGFGRDLILLEALKVEAGHVQENRAGEGIDGEAEDQKLVAGQRNA